MPNNKKDFALTFTQSHPDIVAKELEKMPPYKVASFLKSIPISVAPQVIEKMLSKKVAEICNILEPEKTTKFLTLMEIHSVISVLRHLDPERRRSILAHLPSKLRLCCKILLRYSDNSVGAWAYPQPNIIPFDYTVAEALQLIKNTQNRIPSNIIFIVNRYKAFIGFVDTYKLLQSPPDALIEALTKESEYCLYGTMKLDSILNHPGWDARSYLHERVPLWPAGTARSFYDGFSRTI